MLSTSLTNKCCQNSNDDSEDIFHSSSSYSDDTLDINDGLEEEKKIKERNNFMDDVKIHKNQYKILIDTLDAIGKDANLRFNNKNIVLQLPHFACFILKDDHLNQLMMNYHDSSCLQKINVLIQYLREKDISFQMLVLEFKNYYTSSSIFVYMNLLKYFLKSSKQELCNRSFTILYCLNSIKYNKEKYEAHILLGNMHTYISLIYFSLKGKILKIDVSMNDTIQKEGLIPLVLDEFYLQNNVYKDNIPIIVYCQLQLIFDYFDSKAKSFHLIEKLLIQLRKIRSIKVPKFDQIAQTIRTKNISVILQFRRKNQHLINNDEIKSIEKIEIKSNEPIIEPKTFSERKLEKKSNNKQNDESNQKIPKRILLADYYWNQINLDYSFQDGILFKENDRFDSSTIKSKRKFSLKNAKANMPPFVLARKLDIKSKLYRFFYYDELINKWEYDESSMNQFCVDKGINLTLCDLKFPLILIFNSDETDSIDLCSNMINYAYPDLDNQIYIYALNDKSLTLLNYNLNSQDSDDMKIKPIFLLLHIPKRKQIDSNIGRIVFQIYSFLFIIADISIVIISENNQKNQLSLFKDIIEINRSFNIKDKSDEDANKLDDLNQNKNDNDNKNDGNNKNDDDSDYEFSDDQSIDEINPFSANDFKTELLSKFNNEFIKKEMKFIFLYNSDISDNNMKLTQNNFEKVGKSMLSKYNNLINLINFSVINICNPSTYECFLNVLSAFSRDCHSQIDEIQRNFKYLPLFEMSNIYINFKLNENYAGNFVKAVYARFGMIIENKNDFVSEFSVLPEIQKEMHSIYPLFDIEFSNKINNILSTLQYQLTKRKNVEVSNELKISSENKLKYLSKIIEKEAFWTKEQIINIKNNHSSFLKEEFFEIIKVLYPSNTLVMIYKDNKKILDVQIEEDNKKIQDMFGEFFSKLDKKKAKEINLEEGANYTIRERENEREIKVRVEIGGNLEDLIEQDF